MLAPERDHLLDRSHGELSELFRTWGQPAYRAEQVIRWALPRGATSFEAMSNVPSQLRARLAERFHLDPPRAVATTVAGDGATTKVLLALDGGDAIEAVRMDYDPDEPRGAASASRSTVCVSTQAGCAMGCIFCATGQQGFTRNLTAAEILAQVLHFSRERRVTNVVFMGMGEPLANYEATLRAVRWLIDPDGLRMRARGVTISTVGLPRQIRRLAEEGLQVGLAISLHAPDDDLRRKLVPTSGGVTIDQLVAAGRDYVERTGRRVTFAYALIAGVNDSVTQARVLAKRVRGQRAHINLIPYNPTAGEGLRRPSLGRVRAFQRVLQAEGINATVRIERGQEIAAACGQLRADGAARGAFAVSAAGRSGEA